MSLADDSVDVTELLSLAWLDAAGSWGVDVLRVAGIMLLGGSRPFKFANGFFCPEVKEKLVEEGAKLCDCDCNAAAGGKEEDVGFENPLVCEEL